jgi:iron-sulfur cluster assembly protein
MAITLTEKAASEVKRFMEEQKQQPDNGLPADGKLYLRLSVRGGGCSGFQHQLNLDAAYNPEKDELLEAHGVGLVVDRKSLLYVDGAVVDFHDELNRRGFSVKNPMAKTTCGCGSSFSV